MKTILFFLTAFLLLSACNTAQECKKYSTCTTKEKKTMLLEDQKKIKGVLQSYEEALNSSDVKKVIPLYSSDGVFMPSGIPTSTGKEAIEQAYRHVFSMIKLNIKFSYDEIKVFENFAFARTLSKGKVTILKDNITQAEENRELFILKKDNGSWKIARYMFNKMTPEAH